MNAFKILLVLFGIITILYSCKKDSDNGTSNSPKMLFSSKFESSTDLSLWTQSTGGQAIIDSAAVKFTNITECFQFEILDLIPVQQEFLIGTTRGAWIDNLELIEN